MIQRSLFPSLDSHLQEPEISLIIGPRQAGKTTLMRQLQDKLTKNGEKTLFLSLDNDQDHPYFASQAALTTKIQLEIGYQKGFVFIDEMQRKENAGLFLKGLYDRNLPYKFIVSGSGSLELKEKIHESLAGRKKVFELFPLSFTEFVNYKTDYRYDGKLPEFFSVDHAQTQSLLEEYMHFGGYPRVVLADTLEKKTAVISDIYQSYLEKDIALLLNIQKTESLTQLVRILASQAGNLVNISELSSTLAISTKTVVNYLWYLEKTFIIKRLSPYFKNVRKEITKAPVVYFVDLGLRNYALRRFGDFADQVHDGFLFQNLVFCHLMQNLQPTTSLYFWRTRDGAEVDFVVDTGAGIVPIEVKFSSLTRPEVTRSFRSFLHSYHPMKACIIHLGEKSHINLENTQVSFIHFTDALDYNFLEKNLG